MPKIPARIFAGIFLAMIAASMMGLAPVHKMSNYIPVFCPFHILTGIHCPGCGMTRAILSLMAGNMADAFLYNPFCFFLIFVILISVIPEKWTERFHTRLARTLPAFYTLALSLVLVFWVFDRLIPHFFGW
ncbi:MAG: DUF2752 domain-containing protein [Syntrophorhabdus sp.]